MNKVKCIGCKTDEQLELYAEGMPEQTLAVYLLAEAYDLFEDVECPNCGKSNELDFREERIKQGIGIRYFCEHCEVEDIYGIEPIVEQLVDTLKDELKYGEL